MESEYPQHIEWLQEGILESLWAARLEILRQGVEVLDLSMINPDLPPPRFLIDKLTEASLRVANHRYSVSRGIRKLRSAFADKYFKRDSVTLTFMGDGATRQGSLHETFNLATLWKLPVVFCVENNGYAMGTSVERTASHSEIWKLGIGYDMPSRPVNGMKPEEVAKELNNAMERARKGEGPSFLEIRTYRYRGHSMSDAQHYRTKDEVREKQKQDPIFYVKDVILKKKYATLEEIKVIDARVKKLVAECEKYAEESPYPDIDVMYDSVYQQENYPFVPHKL